MTIRLSNTQKSILIAAAAQPDGSLLPVPTTVTARGPALERTLSSLLRRGLAIEAAAQGDDAAWRTAEDGTPWGLTISPAGRAVVGAEPATGSGTSRPDDETRADDVAEVPAPGGKLGLVLRALSSRDGATLEELAGATGWLDHTTRAALTRLRQRGFDIGSEKVDGRRVYRLHPAA